MDTLTTNKTAAQFCKYLSQKNYIRSELSSRGRTSGRELTLRNLWGSTDLSASDFADEVARFYQLPRVSLPQLIAAPALAET